MTFWQSRYNPQYKLSQQDLLDISKEIIQSYAPHDTHHQPELVLMPVDPVNLYAYWKLKDNKADNGIKHVDKQLVLKIYSIPEASELSSKIQLSFEIKVDGFRNQKKVHLPVAAVAYSAIIGEINADDSFSALATANTIHVPRENPVPENSSNDGENILQTSQLQETSFATGDVSRENTAPENSENTLQISQTYETNFASEVCTQDARFETFIVKNFNDYGYDLKVYHNKSDQELKNILSKQGSKTQLSTKNTNTSDKNTSGQGTFLSWR